MAALPVERRDPRTIDQRRSDGTIALLRLLRWVDTNVKADQDSQVTISWDGERCLISEYGLKLSCSKAAWDDILFAVANTPYSSLKMRSPPGDVYVNEFSHLPPRREYNVQVDGSSVKLKW
jgi:hypothetical protein